MSTLPEAAMATIADNARKDEVLRKIFMEHFALPSNEDIEKNPEKVGYRAWGMMAIEVSVSMANLVIAMRHPQSGRSLRAIQDLAYGLNANDFWGKNAPILVPIMTVMINAHQNAVSLKADAVQNREYTIYDKLTSATELVPLEIFSMILYLVGGPSLMATQSLPLKLALAPYLVN